MTEQQQIKKCNSVPVWLNKDYMRNILKGYFNDENLRVNKLVTKPASATGDNYCSVMIRITVDYTTSKSSNNAQSTYIAKITLEDQDPAGDMFKSYGIYTREMDMYENILPRLAKILQETGDLEKLYAETIYVDRENSVIIFEDLSLAGFNTANRIERLDMAHAQIVLRKLAKMHASAAVLNERSPGVFAQNFDRGMFNRYTTANGKIFIGVLKALIRYVKTQTELKEKYYGKLVALTDNIMKYGTLAYDVNHEDFMTLIHGDCWTANLMFGYPENKAAVRDVIPIDFQLSTWTSPAIDLHYFFNTSLRDELRFVYQPELLQYYYYNLRDTLRALNYQGHIPSLFKFNIQFERRSIIALIASLIIQSLMIYDGTEESTAQNLMSDCEAGTRLKDSYFKNETVKKNIHRLLPIFDRKGLLDKMD